MSFLKFILSLALLLFACEKVASSRASSQQAIFRQDPSVIEQVVPALEASVVSLTPHEILVRNGLPPGLLPNNVTNWVLADNGDFEVNLTSACEAVLDYWGGLPLRYSRVLKGNIQSGRISKLRGVTAEVMRYLVWLNVLDISRANSEDLEFMVTFLTRKFYPTIPAEVFTGDIVCKPVS